MRRTRLSLPRKLLHILVVVIGWVLFIWSWGRVLMRPSLDWKPAALLILCGLIFFPIVTSAWVQHCRQIFRRKGARGAGNHPELHYDSDWNGRTVRADWPALQDAQLIVIRNDATEKKFHLAQPLPPARSEL